MPIRKYTDIIYHRGVPADSGSSFARSGEDGFGEEHVDAFVAVD